MDGQTGAEAGFVGRADELARVDRLMNAVAAGRGGLVTVRGPAGIGKSRFVEVVAGRAVAASLQVAIGRCWSAGGAPPLWPWQTILADLLDAEAVALLDGDAGSSVLDPDRFARFVAVTRRLVDAARETPLVVVVEDAHAADAGTLLLVRLLVRSASDAGVLVVVTHRVDEAGAAPDVDELLDELDRDGEAIVLHHLEPDEVSELLAGHGLIEVDPDLASAVNRITGGNPLFLERLASLGGLRSAADIPRGLRRSIAEAADRLDADARDHLRVAAVLGPAPSITEAAALVDRTPVAVLESVRAAQDAGLVAHVGRGHVAFTHDLVREVLVDGLPAGRLLGVHARAVDVVGGSPNEPRASRLARQAHHATRAASRSRQDAARAVEVARSAADAMVAGFAYEQAAELLHTGVRIHADARLPDGAALHVEEAQAVLLSGRLGEARALFDRAAASAEAENEPTLLAEAALGLGGVWVNEHRTVVDRRRVRSLQQRALAALPNDEEVLACRLRTRLAAEAVYAGGPIADVLTALDDARRIGDSTARAEALSLTHHVLLTPEHTRDRVPLADELVTVASGAGLGVLALMGLCWRAVDLFQLGDPSAERALTDLRDRTDAVGCRSIRYMADVLDVMLLVRAGRFDEAEAAARAAYELGTEVGDADALAYLGAHLVAIRWLQGRDAEALELVEQVTASPSLADAERTFPALEALFAAHVGEVERATRALQRLTTDGVASLPRSSTWLSGMTAVVEAAVALGDARVAQEAAALLAPFADLPVMPSLAVVCLGSVERWLGLAAGAAGGTRSAVSHLERAVGANELLGNRPLVAVCRSDLGEALLRRDDVGDADRADSLLDQAKAEADRLGMTGWVERWAATADRRAAPGRPEASAVLRRNDGRWEIAYDGRVSSVADRVGVGYLAQLLAAPHVDVPALALVAGGVEGASSSRQSVIDDAARRAYGERAEALAAELTEVRRRGDAARVEVLEREVDALTEALTGSTGLLGRDRAFAGPEERARTSVRKAIKRAVDEITIVDPGLGRHLGEAVSTGTACRYAPMTPVRWTVERG